MEKARIYPVKSIPDKLFFKIGEVCDLIDVQPHVLRYWESEFPTLTPQKNRAGQRTYRRKDVEVVFRIKQLLYDEGFTIAGAKKKLVSEMRGGTKLKVVTPEIVELAEVKTENLAPQHLIEETLLEEVIKTKDLKALENEILPAPIIENIIETTLVIDTKVEDLVEQKPVLSVEQKTALRQIRRDLQGLLTRLSRDVIITAK